MYKSRYKHIILLICIFSFSVIANGKNDRQFSTLDYKTVMTRLFETTKFSSIHEALWRPNFEDRMRFMASSDGYCHSGLDTTMNFTIGQVKYATIIFTTYNYQFQHRSECHACAQTLGIAVFKRELNQNWEVIEFTKNFAYFGQWGKLDGKISIVKLGKDRYCLKLKSAIGGGQGEDSGYSEFYNLNNGNVLRKIFSYKYFYSTVGAHGEKKGYTDDKSLKLIPDNNEYNLIEISTKNSHSKVIKKSVFKYSEEAGRYEIIQ